MGMAECPLCRGSGWRLVEVGGHGTAETEGVARDTCTCHAGWELEQRLRKAILEPDIHPDGARYDTPVNGGAPGRFCELTGEECEYPREESCPCEEGETNGNG